MTLVLTGGTVVASLSPPKLEAADVVLEGSRVASIGSAAEGAPRWDCSGCLILPGNACAHTHLYSALARGMPFRLEAPVNFLQILKRIWWRLDRALDEEAIRASALVGGMEALLSGTTTLIDHHASPNAIDGSLDVIAEALEELGVRSVLCYEVTDRDGADRAVAGIEENRRFLAGHRPLARGMVGAHASFTLSEETLAACVGVADARDVGMHIHLAEDVVDQRDCGMRFARRVADRLADAGVLTERAVLAHCVRLDAAEVERVRSTGAMVAHNPRSNMNNGVGRAPVRALGDRVALGTDGIGADLFAESKAAFWRGREDDLGTTSDWVLGRLAEGAAFAGRAFGEPSLGRIESGAPADLIVLEHDPPTPMEDGNLGGHWIFGLHAGLVRDVFVGGAPVVKDRRLTRVDQGKIATEAAAIARKLWDRVDLVGMHPFEPAGRR